MRQFGAASLRGSLEKLMRLCAKATKPYSVVTMPKSA